RDFRQQQWVAQRNELMGSFRCHDAGNSGCAQHVALFRVTRQNGLKGLRLHRDDAFGHGRAHGFSLLAHIDHVGGAIGADMGKAGHVETPGDEFVPRRDIVAAVTSAWRIRLSPTRYEPMPTFSIRRQSAWVKIPLSPTRIRLSGTIPASRSEVSSVVSKVRRLRLLMPMRREDSLSARSISASSCTSINASMPSEKATSSSSRASASS